MREFRSFVTKEFRHIFRDRRTVLIVLIMPVVQTVLFGFAISTEINNARVDIVGDLSDPSVRRIVTRIDNNGYLNIGKVYKNTADIDGRFRKGKADVAVCFENEFDDKLNSLGTASIRIIGDGSDPNSAQMIVNYVTGVINDEQGDIDVAWSGTGPSGSSTPAVKYMYNPGMLSSYNFVPGVMGLILMLICSMMTAVSIVKEKETGTMELLLVSPLKPVWIIVSKMIPYFTLSAVNLATILLLSRFVMHVPLRGSLLLLVFISLTFIVASLAIGLLISVISSTQKTALLISGMGLTMPTMIFSGIIFPCESMPSILQYVSDIIPAKWYIIMMKKIMIEGVGFGYMAKEYIILLAMTAFLLFVSTRLFKNRL